MSACKYCNSQHISVHDEIEEIKYNNLVLKIPFIFSICDDCHKEFISKEQIIVNDARVRDAKKSADGLMTSIEIREAREKLGLTQEQAALIFGGGRNAFSKYERAEVSQSVAMDTLIKICLKHPSVFNELLRYKGIKHTSQLIYENNIIPYSKCKPANQEKYEKVKVIPMREVAYG